MERGFLEDGLYPSVSGVAIVCETLSLDVRGKGRTQGADGLFSNILLVTD